MSEYSISLPQGNNVHKPVLSGETVNITDDTTKLLLSVFDTDGKEGLSSEELFDAFNYFANKEKEIAVIGQKGDGVITNKDIEQIIKKDSKFSKIRLAFNDDKKSTELLSKLVKALAKLVQLKDEKILEMTYEMLRTRAKDGNQHKYYTDKIPKTSLHRGFLN